MNEASNARLTVYAVTAQENDRKGDRTYIPVGPQGVPLVANMNSGEVK